ncbi:nitroreductase [Aquibacillus koreensis]|uniref:Putative NAD(P)H nitroreductase n=1 Tax=Aquibacillus koreensis TaxID=279446 RepID=A0A9X4AIM2_9BACI|nr:nitroreductase [Aquibacillus koreensis]MCT2538177.1 nitroreductase [Aquibacillus koreensis]MDC3420879.1 nitroreductase [Aquibacillus koreensis]
MNLSQLIKERRSIQLYEDRPVSVDLMKELLETAIWVPNHKMTEPWRFVFVSGETKKQIAEINRIVGAKGNTIEEKQRSGEIAFNKINNPPLLLMVLMEENPDQKLREEDYAATSCVIQNLSLLAWEKEIGMIWKTGAITFHPEFRKIIGAKPGEKVVGMLQMGYPAKVPKERPRVDAHERITELN